MNGAVMIDTRKAIADVAARARELPRVAIDTEFVWERTFYPRLGIVQISFSERESFIIDAVALPSLPHLGSILASEKTEKVLHDAQQDLSILARVTGVEPKNIFDTQLAAGFAGMKSTSGLRALLLKAIDVEIPKSETRSNWLRRPLSTTQTAYALNDVRFLPALRYNLEKRARELGNIKWLREELSLLDAPSLYRPAAPELVFRRIRSGRLRPRGLAVLRKLAQWREQEARSSDRPRGRVARDGDLVRLARLKPTTKAELCSIGVLPRQLRGRHAGAILAAMEAGLSVPDADCPDVLESPRPDESLNSRTSAMLSQIRDKCAARGIDPALVATRAEVLALLRAGKNPVPSRHRPLRGWRRHLTPRA